MYDTYAHVYIYTYFLHNSLTNVLHLRFLRIRSQGKGTSMSDISLLKTLNITFCVSCAKENQTNLPLMLTGNKCSTMYIHTSKINY